jgi:excinuclease UvrABC ATPase subunit
MLARPDVDVLAGADPAIIVDQSAWAPTSARRSAPRSMRNAVRLLFSRLGTPHIGPPTAYSFNIPMRKASGAMTVDKGKGERIVVRNAIYYGGMCPRCEGMGSITDMDLTQLYDASKSLNEGAITIPGYSMEGWYGRIFIGSGYFDPDKPIGEYDDRTRRPALQGADQDQGRGASNPTYEG